MGLNLQGDRLGGNWEIDCSSRSLEAVSSKYNVGEGARTSYIMGFFPGHHLSLISLFQQNHTRIRSQTCEFQEYEYPRSSPETRRHIPTPINRTAPMVPETQAGPSRGHKLNPAARSFSPSPNRATSVLAQESVAQNYAWMISSSPAQYQPPSRHLSFIGRQSRPVLRALSEPIITPPHSGDSSPRRQPRATCIGIEEPDVEFFGSPSYGRGRAWYKRHPHTEKMHMMPVTPPDGNAGPSTNDQPRVRTGIFFPADPRMVFHPPSGDVGADNPPPGHTYFKMPANDDDDGWEELAASIFEQNKANNEMQLESQKAHSCARKGSGS